METNERDLTPDSENTAEGAPEATASEDDARFAPPTASEAQTDRDEVTAADDKAETVDSVHDGQPDMTVTDGMDIEAALAAVSTLSDMLAEQEAVEQARIAQIEAEAQAAAEREARMQHPELFFPVPPMSSLHRGQLMSVIPALLLIAIGAWLTFTLTTTKAPPDMTLLAAVVGGGVGVTLLVRWLGSGRWSRGSLFFGLAFLLLAGSILYLSQTNSIGWTRGWPLVMVTVGIAFGLTGVLAIPRSSRLLLAGLVFIIAGAGGFAITMGILSSELVSTIGALWPVAVAVMAVIWALPLIFRQRG